MLEPNNPTSSTSTDGDGSGSGNGNSNYHHHSSSYTTAAAYSKRSRQPPPPLTVPAGHSTFRLLCHASRIGGVIGKSGSIIKQLEHETSARIRVEKSLSGSDDRVIVIVASKFVNRRATLEEGAEVSAAQDALVRVFERILDVTAETDGLVVAPGGLVSCRLLAETSQAGSVIGKGGKVVEKIRKDTGCRIKVFSTEKLLGVALPGGEVIEIEGDIMAVKKGLVAVSGRLQDYLPNEKRRMNRSTEAVSQENLPDMRMDLPPPRSSMLQPIPTSSGNHASGGRPLSLDADRVSTMDLGASPSPQQEVVFRLLCSNDRVGAVIGKGGTIVRGLQNETGASISVGVSVAECDERLITITAVENLELEYSPAQNATILVFNRSVEVAIENGLDLGSKGPHVSARLVVPSSQVGCLLGKGGAIVSEIRKTTGTGIRVTGTNQAPKCASDSDQVVQITGMFANVQDALYKVTRRLRDNLLPSELLNGAGTRSSSSVINEISHYGRARDPPSLVHSSRIPHSFDRHTTLSQSMDHLGLSHSLDGPPSPRLWESQTVTGLNSKSVLDGGRELGSGNRSAIATNTTVEIVVPENVIGSIYGENGSNLVRLRQISGAKVVVHDPRPGTSGPIVIISGCPDETQAAQSLLQAFILGGSS